MLNCYHMTFQASTLCEQLIGTTYNLLHPFMCFTTNQFAQKLKFLANFITYYVNICNSY